MKLPLFLIFSSQLHRLPRNISSTTGSKACKALPTILVVGILASACGRWDMRDAVAMKVSDRRAHICTNEGAVGIGDEVVLFTTRCTRLPMPIGAVDCRRYKLGEGVVIRLINKHYSEILVDAGVEFNEGTRIILKSRYKEHYELPDDELKVRRSP